jgi:pimeloyl-ACP methyl ester carboxylesterase
MDADQCAKVKVPLDYAQPAGEQIDLVVGRIRATNQAMRIGSLFMNPGGPGAPGVTGGFIDGMRQALSPQVRARFDLVSWDPRGVPSSTAVDCKATPTISTIQRTYEDSPATPDKDKLRAAYQGWVSQCNRNTAKMMPFVSTEATTSDLEILRRAVGDAKLSYVGFSAGTLIGLRYLLRYPERTRALVVDGVDTVWREDIQPAETELAVDHALSAFLDWCAQARVTDCPFGRGQGMIPAAAYDALVRALKTRPLTTTMTGRTLNYVQFQFGVQTFLYDELAWPDLATALESARRGDGTAMLQSADDYLGPDDSRQDPFFVILCTDFDPVTEAQVEVVATRLQNARFALPYANLACVGWSQSNRTPKGGTPGAIPPVVLIGSTGDPATPYRWATSTAARLPGSVLLTSVAFTHTAYALADRCIDGPVDAYLIDGTVPRPGIRCVGPPPGAMPLAFAPDTTAARPRVWHRGR